MNDTISAESVPASYRVELLDGVRRLERSAWQALVSQESPFLSYDFLSLLEETGCVGERSGWYPMIVVAYEQHDATQESGERASAPIGALPLYAKTNSEGEFIFDWAWADAAYRGGIEYYPKGVIAVPFSPVTARKLLTRAGISVARREAARGALLSAAFQIAKAQGLSSLHFNFLRPDELAAFEGFPASLRYTMQYHWYNGLHGEESERMYGSFEEYLARFRSKRRANIKRERRRLKESGVTTRVLRGEELGEEQMARMFAFYAATVNKFYYGRQYLNEAFFMQLPERLGEHLHVVFAEQGGEVFGGAFNLHKDDRLYGRYWGCSQEVEFAHFEVCMYTPIEWCIEHGVKVFEPGAGGEHKYERGFEPTTMYSMHYIAEKRLAHGVEAFLEQERAARQAQIEQLKQLNPFKEN